MDRTRIVAAVTTTLSSMFLLLPIVFPPVVCLVSVLWLAIILRV
jgi:hypothetical protein